MKKITTFYIVALFIFSITGMYGQSPSDIVGKWEGIDYLNNPSELIFTEDSFVSFTINCEKLGGENFSIKGQKADLRYFIDSVKNPFWFDFIVYSRTEKIEKGRIKGVLKFIDIDNIQIAVSFDGTRITDFSEKNKESTITLKRIK
ncbi:hypothetical protein [Flavobacterium sp. GNP001]